MTIDEYRRRFKANYCPTESDEQQDLMRWSELMRYKWPELDLLVHIPNGGYRNGIEAARFKLEGVKKGFPDLILPVARKGYHSLAIEMKRVKGGVLSLDQKGWIDALNYQGWLAIVCRGAKEAIEAIEKYMGSD